MKNFRLFFVFLLILNSCYYIENSEPKSGKILTRYTPVYMTLEEIRNSVNSEGPRELQSPGKIYSYGQYLFINELYEGVHIINNFNPEKPENIGFISIPGNVDIAIKNDVLYADNVIDLVAIDIADPLAVKVVKRVEEVIPYTTNRPPDGLNFEEDPAKGYIVGWKR